MAWFGKKDETKQTEAQQTQTPAVPATATAVESAVTNVLIRPRITEKAFALSQQHVYTFVVAPEANKYQVAAAVKQLYKVTPKKVRIVRQRPRQERSMMRNRATHKSGLKKAYVYLNSGDTISFM